MGCAYCGIVKPRSPIRTRPFQRISMNRHHTAISGNLLPSRAAALPALPKIQKVGNRTWLVAQRATMLFSLIRHGVQLGTMDDQ
jgi:hypothetical protein